MSAARQPKPANDAGDIITESVRLTRLIGSGAMGDVWAAEHEGLGAEVVVKILRQADAADEDARFVQEARAIARMGSPYIVQVFDRGTTSAGQPFIVMELLRGEDLRSHLLRAGKMPLADTVILVTQLCRALARAHELGVVHRDIKPANLFLVDAGGGLHLKVLDFGVAKLLDAELEMTATGALVGTPYYMSPEQLIHARNVDHRTDLWSAAVVAYACLAGVVPFLGDTLGALSVALHSGDFKPLREHRPELPEALDAWMQRAFHPRIEERFADAAELADSFARAAEASTTEASTTGAGAAEAGAAEDRISENSVSRDSGNRGPTMISVRAPAVEATPSKRRPPSRIPTWLAALLAGAALAGIAVFAASRMGADPISSVDPSADVGTSLPAEHQQVCPNCGALNGPKNRYCRSCGAELIEPEPPEPKLEEPPTVIDWQGLCPEALAQARKWLPDAELYLLNLVSVPDDGKLVAGNVKLVFDFYSPKTHKCIVLWGTSLELDHEDRDCRAELVTISPPRCSPAEVRRRLRAKLPPGDVGMEYRARAEGGGQWEVFTHPSQLLVDDCP